MVYSYVTICKELLKDWVDFKAMSNRESGAKWEKPWGKGRVVLGKEPILAPIANIDNIWWQNVKISFESFFFAFYIN